MHLTPEQQASLEKLAKRIVEDLKPGVSHRATYSPAEVAADIEKWLATLPEPERTPAKSSSKRLPLNVGDTSYPFCHAQRDGDCIWEYCPQNRDGEPEKTGRHCPIDKDPEYR